MRGFTLYLAGCRGNPANTIYPQKIDIIGLDSSKTAMQFDHVAAKFSNNHRDNDNFIKSDCLMLDIDNTDTDDPEYWIHPSHLREKFPNVAFLICYSRNHMRVKNGMSPRPKFHIYFPIKLITSRIVYANLKSATIKYCPRFDKNASDPARFFFGVKTPEIELFDGEILLDEFMEGVTPTTDDVTEILKSNSTDTIPQGTRNNTLWQFAFNILQALGNTDESYATFYEESLKCTPPLDNKEVESTWNSALKTCRQNSLLGDWGDIVLFDTVETPPFPVDCLPSIVADYVKAVAENTQTAIEMSGVLALGVLAIVMQGKAIIQVNNDYSEQLSLYTVAILESGERKSSIIKHFTKPINEYESKYNQDKKNDFAVSKAKKRSLQKRVKYLEDMLAKKFDDVELQAELEVAAKELDDFEETIPIRLLLNDVTPEKLIEILDKQGGRIGISSGEGNLFDLLASRNDRGTTLLEPMLKGYSGDRLTVDRITRDSNTIDNPHISIVVTAQPCVLTKVIANDDYSGRGLNSRFLFVRCGSIMGVRKSTSPSIPEEVKTKYCDLIFDFLEYEDVRVFTLSKEAEKERQRFYDIIEKRLVNDWHFMREFSAKFIGTTLRIAGLIHGAENKHDNVISVETLKKAIEIAECLGKHAENVYLNMGADEVIKDSKHILKRLEETGYKSPISKTELQSLCQRFNKKVDELNKAIAFLESKNYLKSVKIRSGKKGRPAEWIYINPLLKP
jgi:hypothetical protein